MLFKELDSLTRYNKVCGRETEPKKSNFLGNWHILNTLVTCYGSTRTKGRVRYNLPFKSPKPQKCQTALMF